MKSYRSKEKKKFLDANIASLVNAALKCSKEIVMPMLVTTFQNYRISLRGATAKK